MRLVTIATSVILTAASLAVAGVALARQAAAEGVPSGGAHAPLPPVRAVRLESPVTIDGVLSEPVWQGPPAVTHLTQSDPREAAAPTEGTFVWVAYDDEALYVAAECRDSRPDSIIAQLVRRDVSTTSDRFFVYLDPFHDHRGGYYFGINAAGVLYDGTLFNDEWDDDSWDGVWEGRARREGGPRAGAPGSRAERESAGGAPGAGWTCELKIPFSQLRFRRGAEQVWGVNFARAIARFNEVDKLVFTPKNGSGFVSRFADLVGIRNGHHASSVEVLPYMTGKAEYLVHDPGDPLHKSSRYTPGTGGDLRMSVGNSLTLNATVNPDFGQVEVDPAVVNLSDVETYFQEKRPFFTENARIFGFGNEGASDYWGFNWSDPTFFYSRRIGRAPEGSLPNGTEFSDVPVATHILGAAKLTGKLAPTWNFGTLHAVTSAENAPFVLKGLRSRMEVEPLTYYGVARGQREFAQGYNGLGLMTTLVDRRLGRDGLADQLDRQSLMTGLDGWHFLDRDKVWVLSGWAAVSRVAGTEARMRGLQRDALHYLQRPDRKGGGVDSSATSLTGYGVRVWLNKQKGNLFSNSAIGILDPGFDVSDMGFQWRSDVVNAHAGAGYKWTQPRGWRKYAHVLAAVFESRDFDGDVTMRGGYGAGRLQFANSAEIDADVAYNPRTVNDRLTRGGPLALREPGAQLEWSLQTDGRQRLVYSVSFSGYRIPSTRSFSTTIAPAVEWKPVSNFSLQLGPEVDRNVDDAQYVAAVADPAGVVPDDFGGQHYVFARLDQTTVAANIRLNISFTPNLSLQTFLQPLVASGRYTDYKELARSRSYDFLHHAAYDPATQRLYPDANDPGVFVETGQPSFNFKSLRGNAVLRWEYRPGSALFLVWTQQRTDDALFDGLEFRRSLDRLLTARPDDIFLVKATYHFTL
jgi:hypothetical protein